MESEHGFGRMVRTGHAQGVPVHCGLIQDRERGRDLTQETYARVLRASPSGKSEAYLRVALNLVRDEWSATKSAESRAA